MITLLLWQNSSYFSKLNNDKISSESDSLSGKKFCITGKLHIFANRDELVADIESKGGKLCPELQRQLII